MTETVTIRVHIIYTADGMSRPLSFRQDVPARSVTEAIQSAVNFIRSAYLSGFKLLTWSAENLDRPVELRYVHEGWEQATATTIAGEGITL